MVTITYFVTTPNMQFIYKLEQHNMNRTNASKW